MKKLLLLLAVALLPISFIVAAGAQEGAADAEEPYIELTKVFYFADASDYLDLKEEFQTKFGEQFGVRLKVNTFPRNEYNDKINLMIAAGQLSGMVMPFFPADILNAREDGTILALDDFLADNALWNSMPSDYKNLSKYYGETWAIAAGMGPGDPYARIVRKDWLDNLGMDVPTNMEELREMARAFTEDDPDGNGKDDTWGMTASGFWNMQDIFHSFDCRLNNWGGDPIVWDPNPNAYVDNWLKPEAEEALNYIADLYQNGWLDPEIFTNKSSTMREKMWSGKYGSVFYGFWWGMTDYVNNTSKNDPDVEPAFILGLEGNRKENLLHIVGGGPAWMLLSNTEKPKEMINAYVDTFFGNEDANLWGQWGLEGKTYTVDDEGRVLRQKDPNTNDLYPNPGLTSYQHPLWPREKHLAYGGATPEAIAETEELRDFYFGEIEKAREEGRAYYCPGNLDAFISETYNAIISDIRKVYNEVRVKVITGEMTAKEGLALYRRQAKALGAQQALDECNEAAGLTAPAWSTY